MIDQWVWDEIRQGFALPLDGIHGQAHWLRVWENGVRLSEQTGADPRLVELFAYVHDAKRLTDGRDLDHGRRAAGFLCSLAGVLSLSKAEVELLSYACAHHSEGLTEADVTVQTCWDADRLDLGRVGILPNPRLLCTAAARDPATIEWAYDQSRRRVPTSDADLGTPRAGAK